MRKIFGCILLLQLAACGGGLTTVEDEKVFFAFDSAHISDEARENLEEQALYMKRHPDIKVLVAGHCDERGSTEYNLALGALRAGNAAHVLIAEGIEPERIETISYGKNRPQYLGTGEEVWAKNRNATTTIISE